MGYCPKKINNTYQYGTRKGDIIMVVIGLVGMNMFLVKALADAKEVTVAELVAEPVRKATKAVKGIARKVVNKVKGITREVSNKVVDSVKEATRKGKAILETTLNKVADAVDEFKCNIQEQYYNLEDRIARRSAAYAAVSDVASMLAEEVEALERRVAILEARCNVTEQRLSKTLYCAKELKDKYDRAEANIDLYIDEAQEWQECFERLTESICDYLERTGVAGDLVNITDSIIDKAFNPTESAVECKSHKITVENNLLD
jgi:chromosome segregation ATPase